MPSDWCSNLGGSETVNLPENDLSGPSASSQAQGLSWDPRAKNQARMGRALVSPWIP